ncbi:MAG: 16S rRNA (cytidine(1402)-2'-O)-methyltransferase [Desulfohalobiaceae bacterium]|nr:16S rRNA (cytidine(1402)-2'-O)-methyltransferase [Desulfohalobiaceae bacterium]
MSSNSPRLWVVATPIGNPGDISERARNVLAAADLVCAEDTRQAGLLFKRLGISGGRFYSLFEQNEEKRIKTVLRCLERGDSVALISNAGSPLISDPGYLLVRTCREKGFRVSPVPGPSAPMAALTASGLPTHPFTFLGFMPRKNKERQRTLAPFAEIKTTLIFFERKSRLLDSLEAAFTVLGDREACLSRELTKPYEEFIVFRLAESKRLDIELRGEFTVVIGPPEREAGRTPVGELQDLLRKRLRSEGRPQEIVRDVQGLVRGWDRKSVYRVFIEIQREER